MGHGIHVTQITNNPYVVDQRMDLAQLYPKENPPAIHTQIRDVKPDETLLMNAMIDACEESDEHYFKEMGSESAIPDEFTFVGRSSAGRAGNFSMAKELVQTHASRK